MAANKTALPDDSIGAPTLRNTADLLDSEIWYLSGVLIALNDLSGTLMLGPESRESKTFYALLNAAQGKVETCEALTRQLFELAKEGRS